VKIADIKLYTAKSGDAGDLGAGQGESQCWGWWQAGPDADFQPMLIRRKYARTRTARVAPLRARRSGRQAVAGANCWHLQ
jgi:hypothetical protein